MKLVIYMGIIDYKDVVRSISYDQHEILYNIMQMHNNGEPFECDITYSSGKFYGRYKIDTLNGEKKEIEIPYPRLKYDVCPQFEDVIKITDGESLPIDSDSINSIVIDLPFVVSPHNAPSVVNGTNSNKSNIIFKRFSSYYPWYTMPQSYEHWLSEAYRVLKNNGICIFKTQSTISGGKNIMMPYFSWMVAEKCGFYTLDEFIILAKNRLHSGKIKKQEHARKFHSHFFVFKKSTKDKPLNYFKWLEK